MSDSPAMDALCYYLREIAPQSDAEIIATAVVELAERVDAIDGVVAESRSRAADHGDAGGCGVTHVSGRR